ncbi:MAG: adenosylcobinamide-phosphate synthase CbiB [Candidatus Scalindua sp.]|nr:adenosylcobinamide-phosphate synthase CbiB [Candidatus Scalindua sp.]
MYEHLAIQIGVAFLLDLLIGDPVWIPHPVRIMGKGIIFLEMVLRKVIASGRPSGMLSSYRVRRDTYKERLAGIILTGTIVLGTYFITYEIMHAVTYLGKMCVWAAGAILIYFSLSARDLIKEAKGVFRALESGNIIQARENLSRIVGRDTHDLDEEQIIKGCVETVAENSVDGIIAPLFYAVIGGPPLVMAYKAINTLDSMVGYKNTEFLHLGWASAKLDDMANYVPARIAAILLPVSSSLCGMGFSPSIRMVIRDGQKHPSPNSGIPEAAVAGALGIRLGGPSTYKGVVSDKQFIGDAWKKVIPDNIKHSIKIVFVASVLSVVSGISVLFLAKTFIF